MIKFKQSLSDSYNFVLDLLFPKHCVGCKKEGIWLCNNCQKKIIYIQSPTCPVCNRLTKSGQICPRCRPKSNLTGVVVAAYYQEGPLKEAIHTFKYDGIFDLAKPLGEILIQAFKNRNLKGNFSLIPVPLHQARQAERGFNQSQLLARQLSKELNYPLVSRKLSRIKHKDAQMTLSGKKRRENVRGIFDWQGKMGELKNKNIILVDDVFTTGSTLEECAKVLRQQAGVKQIWGLVLAKV